MGHLPNKSEKMKSSQIKIKIGIDTNSSTRISKIITSKLENNRKMDQLLLNDPRHLKMNVLRLSQESIQNVI